MKKLLLITSLSIACLAFGQKKTSGQKSALTSSLYTVEQVENSNDIKVLANFIKFNPDHPRTPEFKRKLISILNGDRTPEQQAAIAKPTIKPIGSTESKGTSSQNVTPPVAYQGSDKSNDGTVKMLNHLFNADPNAPEAYISIVNNSRCNMIVKISGRKFYNLTVPSGGKNYILVDKGSYNLTTDICDAKYSSTKLINSDIEIALGTKRVEAAPSQPQAPTSQPSKKPSKKRRK